MSVARGLLQSLRDGIVAVLDTHPDVVALTGRASVNVVPWRGLGAADLPVITYFVVAATRTGAPGDTRSLILQFSAFAAAEPPLNGADEGADTLANALLDVVELRFNALSLSLLSPPVDARVDTSRRRGRAYDNDVGAYGADLDLTMTAKR